MAVRMRPEEITSIIPIDWDDLDAEFADPSRADAHPYTATSNRRTDEAYADVRSSDVTDRPVRDTPRRRPLPAEVTQDILIAEIEFDETAHHHPFSVTGARPDDFDPADDDHSFRRLPQTRAPRSCGKHRISAPPTALRGRAALLAVAAGAAVVAVSGQIDTGSTTEAPQKAEPASGSVNRAAAVTPLDPSVTGDAAVAPGAAPTDLHDFTDQLATGDKMARDAKAADAASRTPLYASPVDMGLYQFTSGFAYRWGAFHGGIDFAAPLGTPIHSATDGVVVEAGPASGFGNWIQVKASDGSIFMYGHMASSGVLVTKGEKVMAGQVIARVGNEGFSTGPHVHVERWVNGMKVDPMPWFPEHGVPLSNYTG
ncbi:MAG: M23 family metallopeptidase [Corynebacteriales bacterium]|nr:M23 family metallopeptidase [Mycobacteriales bacterium]